MVHLSILRHTFLANVYDNWLIGCGAFCVLFFFFCSLDLELEAVSLTKELLIPARD